MKQDNEDDLGDDDNCTCGDDNAADADGDYDDEGDDDDIDYVDDDDKMSNNFPQMPGCRLCLSCVRRL